MKDSSSSEAMKKGFVDDHPARRDYLINFFCAQSGTHTFKARPNSEVARSEEMPGIWQMGRERRSGANQLGEVGGSRVPDSSGPTRCRKLRKDWSWRQSNACGRLGTGLRGHAIGGRIISESFAVP
jgi:hypothetical protein